MPPHNPVPSLMDACLSTVTEVFVDVLQRPSANSLIPYIQSFLIALPACIREKLLHYVLDLDLDACVRLASIQILLNPDIKSLITGIFPSSYYRRVAETIYNQAKSIHYLDLRGVWLKDDLSPSLILILENLEQLTILHIPHMANDRVLETLGSKQKNLQILNITGEIPVTKTGIQALAPLTGLKFLLIGNPGGAELNPYLVSLAIQLLPNLENFGPYPYVAQALEYAGRMQTKAKLKRIHDTKTSVSSIKRISETCQELEVLFLDNPDQGVLGKLSDFTRLSKLKLNRFKAYELMSIIPYIGQQIVQLDLLLASGTLNLSILAKECSNLTTLTCQKVDSVEHTSNTPFLNLKKVSIYYSNMPAETVKYVISCCPRVEEISLGDFLEITDDDIIEMFTTREFPYLTDIWFANAVYLTSVSLQVLLGCCSSLKSVGQLSGWSLSGSEILVFMEALDGENLDINLIE